MFWAKLERLGLPGLFHTGIVANAPGSKSFDIDNDRHRPVRLDTIARAFPEFKIIGAHLGNPWVDEAAMAARWCPNLYFDLSGSLLKMKSPAQLGQLLWWGPDTKYRDPLKRHAWEKIVFGSDVVPADVADVLGDYSNAMDALRIPADVRAKVMGGTLAGLLGL